MKNSTAFRSLVLVVYVLFAPIIAMQAQVLEPFGVRYEQRVRGNMTMISNNILNRDGGRWNNGPEVPYNYTGSSEYNDNFNMRYIDIDADNDTFSSSSATLSINDSEGCYKIVYAALYWSGTYPYNSENDNDRENIREVKLKLPGESDYTDINGEVVYDGLGDSNNAPYACYADITAYVQELGTNAEGTYTVANVKASQGMYNGSNGVFSGGSSAGWTIFLVYEDRALPARFITSFDGFASVVQAQQSTVDVPVSGFTTNPVGPVRANLMTIALEGDWSISGDHFRLDAGNNGSFTNVSDALNSPNNFFNSKISVNGSEFMDRLPASRNTLGYDATIVDITDMLDNNETQATMRFDTSGDSYYPFFSAFSAEVVMPDIRLVKKIQDPAGNDIADQEVALGETLIYRIEFKNIGNDDAENFTIRDQLPLNARANVEISAINERITWTHDTETGEIVFNIPNDMVEAGAATGWAEIKVNVATDCSNFTAACSHIIRNQAYATYRGKESGEEINEDPSLSGVNNCYIGEPVPVNILASTATCTFEREEILCEGELTITAGGGFETYTWRNEAGDIVGDTQSITVNIPGRYTVHKEVPGGSTCPDLDEVVDVVLFGETQVNPLLAEADVVETCTDDGSSLPKFFLCGVNDRRAVNVSVTDGTIRWEKLNENGACGPADRDAVCANKNSACTWGTVGTNSEYTVGQDGSGQYRLVISYEGGCFSRFYFNVYTNDLDPAVVTSNIICGNPGNITVDEVPAGYEYRWFRDNILIYDWDVEDNSIEAADTGVYKVEIRQRDVQDGCVFVEDNIIIQNRELTVNIEVDPVTACDVPGLIDITVEDVGPQYNYLITNQTQSVELANSGPTSNTRYTFKPTDAATYHIEVTAEDGSCFYEEDVVVARLDPLQLSANATEYISCNGTGTVELTSGGGGAVHWYAIYRKDGTALNPDYTDDFQQNGTFEITEAGDYQFIVMDEEGCADYANVTVEEYAPVDYDIHTENISCYGESDGSIAIDYAPGGNVIFSYLLEDEAGNDITSAYQVGDNFENLPPGNYRLTVIQTRGNSVCTGDPEDITITQPDSPLTATSGVSETVECDPTAGGQTRIVNAEGGTPPYQYSFDGGVTYNGNNTGYLTSGTHNVSIKDAGGCVYAMVVQVPEPLDPPTATVDVGDYDCEGNAEVTINLDGENADYDYWYEIDGVLNTPDSTSAVFTGITPGNHTIRVNYVTKNPPQAGELMVETFGTGPTVPTPYISSAYCFEPQTGQATACDPNGNPQINDGEYAVTGRIEHPFGTWIQPADHTGLPNGRMLVINVGDVVGEGGIMYRKPVHDVIPDRDVIVSVWGINLNRSGSAGLGDPNLVIQLRDNTDQVVAEYTTADIPKDETWHHYEIPLNPGNRTELDIVILTNSTVIQGNDLALDDIIAYQVPRQCPGTVELPVQIESGREFDVNITNVADLYCHDETTTNISFNVRNFNTATGYEYSVDGGATWNARTTSPAVVNVPVDTDARQATLMVRYADGECEMTFTEDVDVPDAVAVDITDVVEATCTVGAGITVEGSGGVPPYRFSIDGGATWTEAGTTGQFQDVAAGTYTIRVRDKNHCTGSLEDIIIDAPVPLTFTAEPVACYNGDSNGQIAVEVQSGNGMYQFQINGGEWRSPNPPTAEGYYFMELSAGTYSVRVKDSAGCIADPVTVVIHNELIATVTATDISCDPGTIEVSPEGGTGNYVYAYVPAGSTVTDGDFSATDIFEVTTGNQGDYDIYVRDNNGGEGYCEYMETVTIALAPELLIDVSVEAAQCYGETGTINVQITSGQGLYQIDLLDDTNTVVSSVTDMAGTSRLFTNLEGGAYTVKVRDRFGCEKEESVAVDEPEELTADLEAVLPEDCDNTDPDEYGVRFTNYPGNYDGLTVQFSVDNGVNWSSDPEFTGYVSGSELLISMRTYDEATSEEICRVDFEDPFIVPYPPVSLVIDAKAEAVGCDFQVTVEGEGGVPPYTFAVVEGSGEAPPPGSPEWVNDGGVPQPSAEYTFTGLLPGRTYTFLVKDATGCVRANDVDIYDEFDIINTEISYESTPACYQEDNGQITFDINYEDAGEHEDQMRWELKRSGDNTVVRDSNGVIDYTSVPVPVEIDNLPPGEYYLEVIEVDNSGVDACSSASRNIRIGEANQIRVNRIEKQDITCNTPGFVRIVGATGGWGGYTYTLTSPNLNEDIVSTDNVVNITYDKVIDPSLPVDVTISIEDQYGCARDVGTEVLNASQPPQISSVDIKGCSAPFSIEIGATGGSGTYSYSIDNGAGFENNGGIFPNVTAGIYEVMVIDENGCIAGPETVEVYPLFEATAEVSKLLDCSASPDAQITITASGGSGNYSYAIAGGVTVPEGDMPDNPFTLTVPASGEYTVTVYDKGPDNTTTDYTKCEIEKAITVEEPIQPGFVVRATDISCNGADDGTIRITAINNGAEPLSYTLTPMLPGITVMPGGNGFENVPEGSYTVTATGANSCETDSTGILIREPDPIVIPQSGITLTQFGCSQGNNADEASVSIDPATITGGSGTYVTYEFTDSATSTIVQSGSSPQLIWADPAGGDFIINVYDSEGCMGTANLTIDAFDEIIEARLIVNDEATCTNGESVSVRATLTSGNTNKIEWSLDDEDGDPDNNTWQPYGTQITGLAPGSYVFLVRHRDTGCIVPVTHTVAEPERFKVVVDVLNDVTCPGSETGRITIEITETSYTGVFEWAIFDSNDDTTVIKSGAHNASNGPTPPINLEGGSYNVVVREMDSPECSNTIGFGISEPIGGDIEEETEVTVTPITCERTEGSIYILASGGWGGFTYYVAPTSSPAPSESDFTTTRNYTGLTANAYQVWVKDAGGCIVRLDDVNLSTPTPVTADIAAVPGTELQCIGDDNVQVGAQNVAGGSGNYGYRLNRYADDGTTIVSTSDLSANPAFTNLGAGIYSITVEDEWGCIYTTNTITITEPAPIVATLEIVSGITCENDAEIRASATGGTGGPYMFSENINGPYTSVDTFTKGPGTYTVYARDADNCEPVRSNEVTITEIQDIAINLDLSSTSVNCYGDNTGVIRASATGGLGNYVYILLDENQDEIAGQQNTSGVFNGLIAGDYHVKVESNDCEKVSGMITVTEPDELVVDPDIIHVSCYGGSDGRISLTATGGTGTVKYAISPNLRQFDETGEFDGLAAGDYTVIAQDANGCFRQFELTVTQPDELDATLSYTAEICKDDGDASIDVQITGGTAPYETSLNNTGDYQSGRVQFAGLTGGETYVVFIKDANGCETYEVISIPEGVDIVPTVTIAYGYCRNSSFTNEVVVNIADPDEVTRVTYSLDGGAPRTNNIFVNLAPGLHTVDVRHTNGCMKSVSFTVDPVTPLDRVEVTATTDVDCYGAETGMITVQATGGHGNIEYAVQGIDVYQSSNIFRDLGAGTYTIIARDEAGCTVTANATIAGPAQPINVQVVDRQEEICQGDSDAYVEIQVSGGTPPYATSLNGPGNYVNNRFMFTGLSGGRTHEIYVKDSGGCVFVAPVIFAGPVTIDPRAVVSYSCSGAYSTNEVTIGVNENVKDNVMYRLDGAAGQLGNTFHNLAPGLHTVEVIHANGCSRNVSFTVDDVEPLELRLEVNNLNQITAIASGGAGGYEYYVDDISLNGKNTYYISHTAVYTVRVVDANGCVATASISMEFIDIEIPNVFTPNGDGYEDAWKIRNSEAYPDMIVIIYDRYGRELAKLPQGAGWDGIYKGRLLPTGDYWYTLKLNGENDTREFIGHFTLYR